MDYSKITPLIKDNFVYFHKYKSNYFYYRLKKDDDVYEFSIHLSEIEEAELLSQDKAILFLKYIKKALQSGRFTKVLMYV